MNYPDTYNEMVAFSCCRAFGNYFALSEDGFRYFYEGLVSGEILSVRGEPGGIVRVQNPRETVTTTLEAAAGMDASVRCVMLTKDGLRVEKKTPAAEQ